MPASGRGTRPCAASAHSQETFTVEAFQLCVALGPVAVYLLLLGAVNLSRRPLLVSGVRDAAALGAGHLGDGPGGTD